jgi:hypothetical protein
MSNSNNGAAAKMAKNSSTVLNLGEGPKLRTTLLISEDIDRMVEVCAAVEGKQKSQIVNEALVQYLNDKECVRSLSGK